MAWSAGDGARCRRSSHESPGLATRGHPPVPRETCPEKSRGNVSRETPWSWAAFLGPCPERFETGPFRSRSARCGSPGRSSTTRAGRAVWSLHWRARTGAPVFRECYWVQRKAATLGRPERMLHLQHCWAFMEPIRVKTAHTGEVAPQNGLSCGNRRHTEARPGLPWPVFRRGGAWSPRSFSLSGQVSRETCGTARVSDSGIP